MEQEVVKKMNQSEEIAQEFDFETFKIWFHSQKLDENYEEIRDIWALIVGPTGRKLTRVNVQQNLEHIKTKLSNYPLVIGPLLNWAGVPTSPSNEKDDKSSVPVNRYILDVPPKTAFNKQDQDGLLVSWKLTTVGEDQINEARKMALEIFQNFTYHEKPTVNQGEGKEKQLCPLVKSILQLLCNKFEQYLWCDPGNHTEGERYPDFATSSVKVGSQPKFDEFRLLFEVERQVFAANSSSTKLVTSGITGIGQFIQWMHKSNAHTVKYGAVTDYQNWVFLRAVKTNGRWEIGKSHKCLVYNPKSSFFPNQPCSAFENLCLIFLLEQNTQK